MTRQLFAFLALLSGLAALSGPAAASYAHAATPCNASVSSADESVVAKQQAPAKRVRGKSTAEADKAEAERRMPSPLKLRAPVLMGIDRAYE